MKDFIDLQQVYNERALITPEMVPADGSSFFVLIIMIFCGLVLLRFFQHPNHFLPSKLSSRGPDWSFVDPIIFHSDDISSFIKYICLKKYPNHPVLVVSPKEAQIDTSFLKSDQHKHLTFHERSMIANWLQRQTTKTPIAIIIGNLDAKFWKRFNVVCLQHRSHSGDVWLWSQSMTKSSTLESIL